MRLCATTFPGQDQACVRVIEVTLYSLCPASYKAHVRHRLGARRMAAAVDSWTAKFTTSNRQQCVCAWTQTPNRPNMNISYTRRASPRWPLILVLPNLLFPRPERGPRRLYLYLPLHPSYVYMMNQQRIALSDSGRYKKKKRRKGGRQNVLPRKCPVPNTLNAKQQEHHHIN